MARQASSFRRVQRPTSETFIRPVFQKPGPFTNIAEYLTQTAALTDGQTSTLTVRPPAGVLWNMIFASAMFIGDGSIAGNSETGIILVDDDATEVYIKKTGPTSASGAANPPSVGNTVISAGSSSDGPFLLSNSRYVKVYAKNVSSGGTNTCHLAAMVRAV